MESSFTVVIKDKLTVSKDLEIVFDAISFFDNTRLLKVREFESSN